jgi:hypothetical protein
MRGAAWTPARGRRLVDQKNGKRVETTAFRPFFASNGFVYSGSQAVTGRLACLTVTVPALGIVSVTPAPE